MNHILDYLALRTGDSVTPILIGGMLAPLPGRVFLIALRKSDSDVSALLSLHRGVDSWIALPPLMRCLLPNDEVTGTMNNLFVPGSEQHLTLGHQRCCHHKNNQ